MLTPAERAYVNERTEASILRLLDELVGLDDDDVLGAALALERWAADARLSGAYDAAERALLFVGETPADLRARVRVGLEALARLPA